MKKILCEDIGIDCAHAIEAETITKLIQEIKDHIKENHPKLWEDRIRYMSDEEIEEFISPAIKET